MPMFCIKPIRPFRVFGRMIPIAQSTVESMIEITEIGQSVLI